MQEFPKKVRKELRDLAGRAYEIELTREMEKLARQVDAWRAGTIDVWELQTAIHKFHDVPSRELYNYYSVSNTTLHLVVAASVATGILKEGEIFGETLAALGPAITLYKEHFAADQDDESDYDNSRETP